MKGNVLEMFVGGVITIGIITALVQSGRNTVGVIRSAGNAGQGLLSTAITGRNN